MNASAVAGGDAPPAASAERSRSVLFAVAALALLVGAVVWMARPRARTLDPAATFGAWFEPRALPLGLRVAQAEQLARGDLVVRLERPDLEPEPPRAASPSGASKSDAKAAGESPRFDWSKVDYGAPGAPPREVLIVQLPTRHARADLDALFKGGVELRGDYSTLEDSGGKRILRRGLVDWGELECAWVHEREFEAGGTFRDVVRVNLSREREPRILIARFGRGVEGAVEPIEALLATLAPSELARE